MPTIVVEQKALKDWVLAAHLTVQDFAELVDVTPQAVYAWYAGGKISRLRLKRICAVLGITKEQILC